MRAVGDGIGESYLCCMKRPAGEKLVRPGAAARRSVRWRARWADIVMSVCL